MKKFMNKIRKNNKGFTLVELIIVVAIIAILTAVLAPQYIKYVERSRDATLEAAGNEVETVAKAECAMGYLKGDGTITVNNNGTNKAIKIELANAEDGTLTYDTNGDGTAEDFTSMFTDLGKSDSEKNYVITIEDSVVTGSTFSN